MKTYLRSFAVVVGLLVGAFAQASALTVSATISTTTVNTPGGMLFLNKQESLTYTLTGTATGQIRLEKSFDGTNFATTGISVTATGAPSTTGTLYSGDKNAFYRWRASTMTAGQTGTFVTTLYDNDDVVQEFKNNKGIPIVVITDDGISISGTISASSATIGAATLNSNPVLSTPTLTNPTLSGSVTTAANSTTTTNGIRLDNSTGTWTGTQTFSSATITNLRAKGTTTNDNAVVGFIGEYTSSACAGIAIATGTYAPVCGSIALTAGDWDVTASLDFYANGATYTRVDLEALIGTATGDNITGSTQGETYRVLDHSSGDTTWNYYPVTMSTRKSIASTTTYYLKAYGGATSAGNPKIYGIIRARRAR